MLYTKTHRTIGEGRDFVILCYNRRGGYSSQCYTTHFASDSASIIQQFTGTIAPKRGGMSEITHPHAAVFT